MDRLLFSATESTEDTEKQQLKGSLFLKVFLSVVKNPPRA